MSLLAQIYRTRHSAHLYAPDTEGAPAGGTTPAVGGTSIPTTASPTGEPIPTAPAREPGKVTQITPDAPPAVKQKGVVDVKSLLKLKSSPKDENDAEAKEITKKAQGDTIIPVPKAKKTSPPKDEEPETPEAKAAAEKAAADKKVADDAAAAAGTTPAAKIKIKDKEMTADEVAKYIDDLEKKANPTPAPESKLGKPAEPAAAAPGAKKDESTPEAKAAKLAEEKRLDEEFLNDWMNGNPAKGIEKFDAIDQKTFDKMLADGDAAAFNRLRQRDQLALRKWVESVVNPALQDISKSVDPAIQMHNDVAKYRTEMEFYAKPENADLTGHKKTVRMISETLATKYPEQWAGMSDAERATEIAIHSRDFIKNFNIQPEAAAAAAASPNAAPAPKAAAPTPKPPQPKPPTGNIGGTGAPAKASPQRSMIANLEAKHG